MMVLDVFANAGMVNVEIDGILIFFIRVEAIIIQNKASNGCYVEKGGVSIPQGSWKV